MNIASSLLRLRLPAFIVAICLSGSLASPGQVHERIVSFNEALSTSPNRGSNPNELIQSSDGNFYGTTNRGGSLGNGSIFRMTPAGELTTLVDIAAANVQIVGGLVRGLDGNFYGTIPNGGTGNSGTIFRMTPTGAMTTLVNFTGTAAPNKGSSPQAGLVEGIDGNFYGTTSFGGSPGVALGTIFKMTPNGTLTTLVEFTGTSGIYPGSFSEAGFNTHRQARLMQASDGNFYGTTPRGGASDAGTIFMVTPNGLHTTLVEFTGTSGAWKGTAPRGTLVQGVDGSFYGTTALGGSADMGTVFKLNTDGTQGGTSLSTLLDFSGANGNEPRGGLVAGSEGNFFGTTIYGGVGTGTAFMVTPTGAFTNLFSFTPGGEAGVFPVPGLLKAADGNFYGTASAGGNGGYGTIFKMGTDGTPAGTTMTTVVSFNGDGAIGTEPQAGLVEAADGNFHGTTESGGPGGNGTVYRMTPGGDLTTLSELATNSPQAPVTIRGGDFYTTSLGSIHKVTPAGVATELLRFTGTVGPNKGTQCRSGLLEASDGHFYGATSGGGAPNMGTLFKLETDGTFAGSTLTTLLEFTGANGSAPNCELIQLADGSFYGATSTGGQFDKGTIFKLQSDGTALGTTLTTLVDFNGISTDSNRGSFPTTGVIEGPDGQLYGTTQSDGASSFGTVFKLTTAGVITTLVDFSGPNGGYPRAGLMSDPDGFLYGTTSVGGASDAGIVFKMTSAGTTETLFEFTTADYGKPNAGALIRGSDGNLYGTTGDALGSGSIATGGSIYRIIFPGAPMVANAPAVPPGSTSAVVQAKVNPRGSSTVVTLEYWTGGMDPPDPLPTPVPIAFGLTGFQSQLVGTTITGLEQGTVYYFRFRAESNAGMTNGPVATFSPIETVTTLAAPVVVGLPATNIAPTSAILNGTVNARNFESTVIIEWGTDGNSFPNEVATTPATVTGNTPVPVSFALGNQLSGQVYFYRIVATNAGGTSTSGTQSYRTLTPATARITDATALSTTRAQVTGFVDPKGSSANVSFEYGTDGIVFPNSFTASPTSVSGELETQVTATLTGLTQGTTYHFRIKADGPGGVGFSEISTLSLSILSGLQQVFPDPPPPSDRTVTVNFTPPEVGAWRFTGDTQWRNSGVPAENLANGLRVIEFLPIPGFNRPPSETVDVTGGGDITLDRIYFQTPAVGSASLTVRLKPDGIAAAGVPVAERIQWRIIGETVWRNSDDTFAGLVAGTYLVESKPVVGRETPPTISVNIADGDSQDLTLTYFTANASGGLPPLPQTFSDVSTNEDQPFAYVGQIRSEVGSSTGFVVKRRVVATAGHVVFDDGTLSAVTDLQWLFQRHTGEHEPRPQIPRGYYLAAGYADQRILDNSPGEGSAQSQTLDYAAIYFTEEAGRGGYGGFLASDSGDDNEFLTSTADKFLAGYPVDGIPAADKGKLHATAPFTAALTPAFGETWTTTDVRGLGGISGGPLFVRFENGPYLPAAIYLGGAGQTVVRAIDSDVIELFLRAEVSGNGGDNNTGGGITHTSVAGNLNVTQAGALKVIIEPATVNSMGASWQLNPEATLRQSGSQKSGLSSGTYSLSFANVTGFLPPTSQSVSVTGGQLTTITFTYQAASPLDIWRQEHFQTTENTGDAADAADPDLDGVTNIDEFTAGTDPNNRNDLLRIASPTKSGTTFTATVAGKTGRLYKLQRNPNLTDAWITVATEGPLATDGQVSLPDTSASSDNAYYRIEVSIP